MYCDVFRIGSVAATSAPISTASVITSTSAIIAAAVVPTIVIVATIRNNFYRRVPSVIVNTLVISPVLASIIAEFHNIVRLEIRLIPSVLIINYLAEKRLE